MDRSTRVPHHLRILTWLLVMNLLLTAIVLHLVWRL